MRRVLEWLLVIVGSTNGLIVTATFAQYEFSDSGSILEFFESMPAVFFVPGIYFLEIITISLLPIISVWRNDDKWLQRLWAGIGALLGLILLGAWTIGPPLIPSLLLFVILGILISLRLEQELMRAAKIVLLFLGLQVVIMLIVIWLHTSGIIII